MGVAYNSRIITDGLVLALDAGNSKSFYGYWSGSYGTAANAFDGNLSTFSGGAGGTFSATYTFNNGLDVSGTVRVYVTFGASSGQVNGRTGVILVDGIDISSKMAAANVYASSPGWVDVTSEVGSIFNTVVLNGTSGSTNPSIAAIEVNGEILVGTTWAGTTWTDLSGNGNNGTLVNGVGYNSGNGGALSFDGVDDFVSNTMPSPGAVPITFDFWMNSDTSTPVGLFDTAPGVADVLRNYNVGDIEWWPSSPLVSLGLSALTWTNITIEYSFTTNRTIKYYRNGNLITTATGSVSSTFAWTTLIFGNINGGSAGWYSGKISTIKIYNRALTAQEIQQNYNALKSRYI